MRQEKGKYQSSSMGILKIGKITEKLGEVQPAFCGEYQFANLRKIPPR